MLNKIKFLKMLTMAIGMYLLSPISPVMAEYNEACQACKNEKIEARWSLRQECFGQGGNDQSCNGPNEGDTCCHCTKSPKEDPNCWNKNCDTECWSKQCEEECPKVSSNGSFYEAGPIWNHDDAKVKCPKLCEGKNSKWINEDWHTTIWGQMSVCKCAD